jgi:hypothetical protein
MHGQRAAATVYGAQASEFLVGPAFEETATGHVQDVFSRVRPRDPLEEMLRAPKAPELRCTGWLREILATAKGDV